MKSIRRSLAVAVVSIVGLVSATVAGQDTLGTWGSSPDKVAKKVYFGPAAAGVKKLASIGMPKRVGLISFYLFDSGSFEHSAMAATYGGTYYKSFGLNARGANTFASAFAERGVPELKQQFAAHGMELLTPVEFLETKEQMQAYVDFTLPKSGFQKFAGAMLKFLDKNPHASGAADGFEMIPTHLWMDRGILNALEPLRQTLGLDGLAVLANTTSSNPKSVIFSGAVLQIIGPNPEPRPDNKLAAKYWTPLIPYVTGTFGKGFKGVPFAFWKKQDIDRAEYDGYDGIVLGLAQRTLEQLQGYVDKGK